MGKIKDKRIIQTRAYHDPNNAPVPDWDYDYIYPKTVYDAITKTFDDDAITLNEEINSIYRLISQKQPILSGGVQGSLMTWTNREGEVGSTQIVKSIAKEAVNRSHTKVASERAVGQLFDTKLDKLEFLKHSNNSNIHISEEERDRWNNAASNSLLNDHINNKDVHTTVEEKAKWNNKVDLSVFNEFLLNRNNPHAVTAHQVGTYSRNEIDDMIRKIRDSFFNYKNISYNDRTNTAELTDYNERNWNPNYVLQFGEELPTVTDETLTYFALKPATDYSTNETQVANIYIKKPGVVWTNIGTANMEPGDMVIRFKDTTMYVWMQGRFVNLFNSSGGSGGSSDLMWRPVVSSDGVLTWSRSTETLAPDPVTIKGPAGKTPVKGVDYFDGANGQGVPKGGNANDILVKSSDTDFDSKWKSVGDAFEEYIKAKGGIPKGLVRYEDIEGIPKAYTELGNNTDGYVVQNTVTVEMEKLKQLLLEKIGDVSNAHVTNYNNPHRVTPEQIGAVTNETYLEHITNHNNPHNVTKEQIGLSNVDNTSDKDKPMSDETREAVNELKTKLKAITDDYGNVNFVTAVTWKDQTCTMTFTFKDRQQVEIEIPVIKIFKTLYFDDDNNELVLVLPDGSEHRIDIKRMITHYVGVSSENIRVEIDNSGNVKATIKPDSVTGNELVPSIKLRENPTTTTQPVGDKSTKIATTEFAKSIVIDNLISYETDRPLSANMGRILNQKKADVEDVLKLIKEHHGVDIIDNLESTNEVAALSANMGRHLNLTKAPKVHTSPSGATFGKATIDLFGHVRISNTDPLMDGIPFIGTDDGFVSRSDHRHPTDTTRAPINWPDDAHNQIEFTGEPKTVSPPDDSNDHRLVNTEWVRRNAIGVMKGDCHTSSTSANKVVTLRSTYMDPVVFMRQIGSTVSVLFTNEDRSGGRKNPTHMNVNNTGNAKILYGGKALVNGMLGKDHEHMFVFDGLNWRLINPVTGSSQTDITIGPGKPPTQGPDPNRKITINRDSGYSGVTVNVDNTQDSNGAVQYAWITLPFAIRRDEDYNVELSADISSYGIRVGDGRIMTVNEFKIVSKTTSNVVIQFKMDEFYPSNSPCQLMFLTNKAYINITQD